MLISPPLAASDIHCNWLSLIGYYCKLESVSYLSQVENSGAYHNMNEIQQLPLPQDWLQQDVTEMMYWLYLSLSNTITWGWLLFLSRNSDGCVSSYMSSPTKCMYSKLLFIHTGIHTNIHKVKWKTALFSW